MISTVLTTATTYVRNYTQVLIMVYRESQVIFSFCIFSVFPSFFHKHINFTTQNKGQSLLRPGLGHGDTCLLGPASSVAGFCACHITHTMRSDSHLCSLAHRLRPLFITLPGPSAQNKDTAFQGLPRAWALCRAQTSLAQKNRRSQFRRIPSPLLE